MLSADPDHGLQAPRLSAALWLSLGSAVATGFGRLAYALILPAMRADLGWTYTQAGSLNSANGLGYLFGSLSSFYAISRFGARRLFIVGMYATSIALILSGLVTSFAALATLRFAVGAAGAAAFIAGAALAAALYPASPRRASAAIAVYFAGGGVGIALSGGTLPWLFALAGNAAWHFAWIAMGSVALLASLACAVKVRHTPSGGRTQARSAWDRRAFLPLMISYFMFGLGYIAYTTFIIVWMRLHGAGAREVATTWTLLGVSTVLSSRVWRQPLATWTGGRCASASIVMLTLGATLPLLSTELPSMLASAILFGGAVFIVPASITAYARKWLPAHLWGTAVAGFTIVFATGQMLGPVVTGALSDATGSLFAGLTFSVGVLVLGAVAALVQADTRHAPQHVVT